MSNVRWSIVVPEETDRAWRKKHFELVTSEWQLDEFRRVSRYPKLRWFLAADFDKEAWREVEAQLASIPEGKERLLLATGRYIGEGFDDARLDTLFLALPVSWRGTLVPKNSNLAEK